MGIISRNCIKFVEMATKDPIVGRQSLDFLLTKMFLM